MYAHLDTYVHVHLITYAHTHLMTCVHIHLMTYVHVNLMTYVHVHLMTYVHVHLMTYVCSLHDIDQSFSSNTKRKKIQMHNIIECSTINKNFLLFSIDGYFQLRGVGHFEIGSVSVIS